MQKTLMSSNSNGEYAGIVEKIKQDDLKAFGELYDGFYSRVMGFAFKFLKSRELAEEVVHDAFMKVWEHRKKLDSNLSINAFLFKITHNLMLNSLRVKVEQPKYFQTIQESDVVSNKTEIDVHLNEIEMSLTGAIEALPVKRRQIFMLSKLEGYSNKEIADELNISTNTVAGQLRKATKTLKATIKFAATI
ncbi:RNA polymerase sigma-70 factor [Reichenbachiella sp. MALMAid0571]|uniref:RNA polymerase sigma factor n=1 Tax=Reichenbachiella sp. MALMAid0571 TaxID=3143939 RepID=UPI0032DF56EE